MGERGGGVRLGGQGGCDRRIEVFGEIHKKKIQGVGRSGGFGLGGQGGCDRRILVFWENSHKNMQIILFAYS